MITFAKEKAQGAINTLSPKTVEHTNPTVDVGPIQEAAERLDHFKRLERGFNAAGWSFYNLADDAALCVHRKWGMHQVCHDLRAASALLRRIGGTA